MTGSPIEADFTSFRDHGDLDALARVFDRLAPELVLVAAHLAGGDLAEDIVQATFLDAIQASERWDDTRPLTPWLIGILANHVHEARRQRARLPDPSRLPERSVASPEQIAEARELTGNVQAAVERLPRHYRQVLALRLVHDLELREIAHALGLPIGTVKTRLARGLVLLRRALPITLAATWPASGSLAAMRAQVIARARELAPLAVVGAAAPVWSSPTLATAFISVALLIGAGAWLATPPRDGSPSTPITASAAPRSSPSGGSAIETATSIDDADRHPLLNAPPTIAPTAAVAPWIVRVVGPDGTVRADIPIVFEPERFGGFPQQTHKLGETAADGQLTVADPSSMFDRGNCIPVADRGTLRADVIGIDPTGMTIERTRPPSDVMLLEVPAIGALTLGMFDHDGGELTTETAFLQRADAQRDGFMNFARTWTSLRQDDGRAKFAPVAVGVPYVVSVAPTRTQVEALLADGEERFVDNRLGDDCLVVRGRAVHADGSPADGQTLSVRYELHGGRALRSDGRPAPHHARIRHEHGLSNAPTGHGLCHATTSNDGTFHWLIHGLAAGAKLSAVITCAALELDALVENGKPLTAGINDLGSIVLAPPSIVVRGEVRCPNFGDPRDMLQLTVQRPAARTNASQVSVHWTDATHFEILGSVPTGPLQLQIASRDYLELAPIEFERGDSLIIQLESAARVTATLRADRAPRHGIELSLVAIDATDPPRPLDTKLWSQRMTDVVTGSSLRPARYRLEIRVHGSATPIPVGEPIELHGGQQHDLGTIDLDAIVPAVDLVLTDAHDVPLAIDGFVRVGTATHRIVGGRARMPVPAEPLLVCVPGYRTASAEPSDRDIRVPLQPVLRVRLRLAGAAARLPTGIELRASLRGPLDEARWQMPLEARPIAKFDEHGECLVEARELGRHRIDLEWVRGVFSGHLQVEPRELDVTESGSQQAVELVIREAEWSAVPRDTSPTGAR